MSQELDPALSQDWYDGLPQTFRDLDKAEDLWGYLRLLGDYAGGLRSLADTLEGQVSGAAVEVAGPPALLYRLLTSLVADGEVDAESGGLRVPIEYPFVYPDPSDDEVVYFVTTDWTLGQPSSVPSAWVKWLAQVLSARLTGLPEFRWRAWMESPLSRLDGSLASLLEVTSWHVLGSVDPIVERDPVDMWLVTVTVPEIGITSSLEALEADLAAHEPAGVRIQVVAT